MNRSEPAEGRGAKQLHVPTVLVASCPMWDHARWAVHDVANMLVRCLHLKLSLKAMFDAARHLDWT